MIEFKIYWKNEMEQKTKVLLEQLGWEKEELPFNRISYGKRCNFHIHENYVQFCINDINDESKNINHGLDFYNVLRKYVSDISSVELFYNGEETSEIFYNHAHDDVDNDNMINKYVKIRL
jgi:hypothetical protein